MAGHLLSPRNPKVTFPLAPAVLTIEDADWDGSSSVSEMRLGTDWMGLPALRLRPAGWL